MVQSIKLNWKPEEVIFEIELLGTFNPDRISALWLFEKGILGESEAKTVNEKYHNPAKERAFSTKFLDIKIKENSIKIGIIDLKVWDLLSDFVGGLIKVLESSFNYEFSINLRLHFSFGSKKEMQRILMGLVDQKWQNVEPESKFKGVIVNTSYPNENHILSRDIIISPCPRKDLNYPIHINILNKITPSSNKGNIFTVLSSDMIINTLNDSLSAVNKVTDQFFIL